MGYKMFRYFPSLLILSRSAVVTRCNHLPRVTAIILGSPENHIVSSPHSPLSSYEISLAV
ncbi:unnamed protein product, partial [Brassica rapa]